MSRRIIDDAGRRRLAGRTVGGVRFGALGHPIVKHGAPCPFTGRGTVTVTAEHGVGGYIENEMVGADGCYSSPYDGRLELDEAWCIKHLDDGHGALHAATEVQE